MSSRSFEHNLLRLLLWVLGLSAMGIALLVFTLGTGAVTLVENTYDALIGRQLAPARQPSPTIDSELRFYAPFWFGYGVLLIWAARQLRQRLGLIPLLTLPFFVGGLGRLLSVALVGWSHPGFVILMVIELLLPPLFILLYWRLR